MLRRRPTSEEILKEAMTSRLRILPEMQKRTQQGILLDDVDFDDFDLSRYDSKTAIMNERAEKGTQTEFPDDDNRNFLFDSYIRDYPNALQNRRDKMTQTFREMLQQDKGVQADLTDDEDDDSNVYNHLTLRKGKGDKSTQTFKYIREEKPPAHIEDDDEEEEGLTPSRIAKEALGLGLGLGYYGGKLAYHGIRAGINLIDALNERRETSEEEEEQQVERIMRRGASRSRSNSRDRERSRSRDEDEEQPSGSNDAIRLLRRGASRSRSATPPKKGKK